jgi:hypothetical protein
MLNSVLIMGTHSWNAQDSYVWRQCVAGGGVGDGAWMLVMGDASVTPHYRLGLGVNHAFQHAALLPPLLTGYERTHTPMGTAPPEAVRRSGVLLTSLLPPRRPVCLPLARLFGQGGEGAGAASVSAMAAGAGGLVGGMVQAQVLAMAAEAYCNMVVYQGEVRAPQQGPRPRVSCRAAPTSAFRVRAPPLSRALLCAGVSSGL